MTDRLERWGKKEKKINNPPSEKQGIFKCSRLKKTPERRILIISMLLKTFLLFTKIKVKNWWLYPEGSSSLQTSCLEVKHSEERMLWLPPNSRNKKQCVPHTEAMEKCHLSVLFQFPYLFRHHLQLHHHHHCHFRALHGKHMLFSVR